MKLIYVDIEKIIQKTQYIVLLDLIAHPKSNNQVRAKRLKIPYHALRGRVTELVKKGLAIKLCVGIYTYNEKFEEKKI